MSEKKKFRIRSFFENIGPEYYNICWWNLVLYIYLPLVYRNAYEICKNPRPEDEDNEVKK